MRKWNNVLKSTMKFSVRDTFLTLGILAATTAISFALQVFDKNSNYASMLFVMAVFLIAQIGRAHV